MLKKQSLLLVLACWLGLCFASTSLAAGDFSLKDVLGKTHRLSQYAGKWVVVNYWATWCPPCLEEIPELVALYDARKDKDLVILGVVFDYESVASVEAYVDDMLMSYPIVLGNDAIVKQIGPADALPTTYIYNPKGRLVKTKRGLISQQYLEAIFVDKTLSK